MEHGVLEEELAEVVLPPVMDDEASYAAVTSLTRAEAERHELWDQIRCFVGPHGAVNVELQFKMMQDVDLDVLDDPVDQQGVSDACYNGMVFEVVDIMAVLKHKLDAALVRETPPT